MSDMFLPSFHTILNGKMSGRFLEFSSPVISFHGKRTPVPNLLVTKERELVFNLIWDTILNGPLHNIVVTGTPGIGKFISR